MKKIKNYMHLYLGCDCFIGDMNWKSQNISNEDRAPYTDPDFGKPIKCKMDLHSIQQYAHKLTMILRPLSDMTEEEAEHFAWMCMDSKHHLDKDSRISKKEIDIELAFNDDGLLLDSNIEVYIGITCRCFEGTVVIRTDGSISVVDEQAKEREPIDEIAEKVCWLISKHFDLFGLIESGLAIDKTEHKTI